MTGESDKSLRAWIQQIKTYGPSGDTWIGLGILAFSLVLLLWLIPYGVEVQKAGGMAVTPSFFPNMIAGILALLSLCLLISNIVRKSHAQPKHKVIDRESVIIMILIVGSYFGIELLGMIPAGIITLSLLIRLYNYRSWPRTIIYATVCVILLFLFFEKVAQVDLPNGYLFDYFF